MVVRWKELVEIKRNVNQNQKLRGVWDEGRLREGDDEETEIEEGAEEDDCAMDADEEETKKKEDDEEDAGAADADEEEGKCSPWAPF